MGLGIGAVALLRNDNVPSSGRGGSGGRAYERFRGITGTEAQYKRQGGGDVKYTKKGQPYVIGADGKAKFIKKSRR